MNIFLKSVIRQPVRTFLSASLIAVAAFALVRVTEFAVVRGELFRIESHYRSVGVLSPLRFNNYTTDHDVRRALGIMEANPHVAVSDARRFTQGVLADTLNITAQYQFNYFNPGFHGLDIPLLDHYFIGSIVFEPGLLRGDGPPTMMMQVLVEELLAGDPSVLRDEERSFTNDRGQTSTLTARYVMRFHITEEKAELFKRRAWQPLDGLERGERVLLRAAPIVVYGRQEWYLQPLTENGGFFIKESDGTAIYATLAGLQKTFDLLNENLSSVTVIDTHDMTAIPRFVDRRVTRLMDSPLFSAGRWLTEEDYGKPVAVLPAQLALRRGLHVGETFTVTLRDNPQPAWIDTPSVMPWSSDVENWWENNPSNWWGMIEYAHGDWRDLPTYELTLEVVGVYWFAPPFFTNFTSAEIFIPAGLMPEGFGWDGMPLLTGMYSFVLDSPRSEDIFLRQTREALTEAGFAVVFLPNGFNAFKEAADPILFSVTVNVFVFGITALLIFALAVYLYIRQWRKTMAINRALGIPPLSVLRQLIIPLLFFWVPAVGIGSLAAWFFALSQARKALDSIAVNASESLLAAHWLGVFIAAIVALIFIGVLSVGFTIVHSPVLKQLQGGLVYRKAKSIDPGDVPEGFTVGTFILKPLVRNVLAAYTAPWRFNLRHIIRTPVKSALAFTLSFLFIFSLGWVANTIVFTESEIERLWKTTVIGGELFRNYESEAETTTSYIISPIVWDAIASSGFVTESYLESPVRAGQNVILGVSHLHGLVTENTKTITDEQLGVICDDMAITFIPGFGAEDFTYTQDGSIPVIVRRGMEEINELPFDARIIGAFDGGLRRAVNRFGESEPVYIIPMEAHYAIFSGSWPFYGQRSFNTYRPPYMTARFTINPEMNRKLNYFRGQIEPILRENKMGIIGEIPLLLLMNDDVLHEVIAPMEQNLSLLRILYPIVIAAAFALSVGMSLLTMMKNAVNAAIIRVLGKSKIKTQSMLCAEQIMVCIAGVLSGLGALLIGGIPLTGTVPLLAVMYIGGTVIGSVIGSVILNTKSLIDILQVRE